MFPFVFVATRRSAKPGVAAPVIVNVFDIKVSRCSDGGGQLQFGRSITILLDPIRTACYVLGFRLLVSFRAARCWQARLLGLNFWVTRTSLFVDSDDSNHDHHRLRDGATQPLNHEKEFTTRGNRFVHQDCTCVL